jgi:hypothetical protein
MPRGAGTTDGPRQGSAGGPCAAELSVRFRAVVLRRHRPQGEAARRQALAQGPPSRQGRRARHAALAYAAHGRDPPRSHATRCRCPTGNTHRETRRAPKHGFDEWMEIEAGRMADMSAPTLAVRACPCAAPPPEPGMHGRLADRGDPDFRPEARVCWSAASVSARRDGL